MALHTCSNCGHYYVTEEEREGQTVCPYCRGKTIRLDPHDETYLVRLLRVLGQSEAPPRAHDAPHWPR